MNVGTPTSQVWLVCAPASPSPGTRERMRQHGAGCIEVGVVERDQEEPPQVRREELVEDHVPGRTPRRAAMPATLRSGTVSYDATPRFGDAGRRGRASPCPP